MFSCCKTKQEEICTIHNLYWFSAIPCTENTCCQPCCGNLYIGWATRIVSLLLPSQQLWWPNRCTSCWPLVLQHRLFGVAVLLHCRRPVCWMRKKTPEEYARPCALFYTVIVFNPPANAEYSDNFWKINCLGHSLRCQGLKFLFFPPLRLVRSGRCLQWLDRCVWSCQQLKPTLYSYLCICINVLIHINCTAKGMLLFFIIVMNVYVHDVM